MAKPGASTSKRSQAGAGNRSSNAQILDISRSATVSFDVLSLSDQVWDLSRVQNYMVEAIEDILARRGVPRKFTSAPSMEITVPAIEAMRYSPLRREIAALIATTMDDRRRDDAHPAFLNLLSQLTRDEIRMLDAMPDKGCLLPMANLFIETGRNRSEMIYRHVVPEALAAVCEAKSRIPGYVDNLRRLQMIDEPTEFVTPASKLYSQIVKQPFCKRIVDERGLRQKARIERRVIALTDFGAAFRDVCIA